MSSGGFKRSSTGAVARIPSQTNDYDSSRSLRSAKSIDIIDNPSFSSSPFDSSTIGTPLSSPSKTMKTASPFEDIKENQQQPKMLSVVSLVPSSSSILSLSPLLLPNNRLSVVDSSNVDGIPEIKSKLLCKSQSDPAIRYYLDQRTHDVSINSLRASPSIISPPPLSDPFPLPRRKAPKRIPFKSASVPALKDMIENPNNPNYYRGTKGVHSYNCCYRDHSNDNNDNNNNHCSCLHQKSYHHCSECIGFSKSLIRSYSAESTAGIMLHSSPSSSSPFSSSYSSKSSLSSSPPSWMGSSLLDEESDIFGNDIATYLKTMVKSKAFPSDFIHGNEKEFAISPTNAIWRDDQKRQQQKLDQELDQSSQSLFKICDEHLLPTQSFEEEQDPLKNSLQETWKPLFLGKRIEKRLSPIEEEENESIHGSSVVTL